MNDGRARVNAERFRLIVAGGGTGGHFFPGLAVAQAVVALRPESEVLFVGSARGIEARLAQRSGFPFKALPASGFASVSAAARVRALASVPAALALGLGTLLQTRPHAVLGVGGYASVPMGLAAGLSGIPLVLLEQNVAPGLANRLLSRFAALVAVAFPQTKAAFRGKGRVLGNPVRASLTAVPPELLMIGRVFGLLNGLSKTLQARTNMLFAFAQLADEIEAGQIDGAMPAGAAGSRRLLDS